MKTIEIEKGLVVVANGKVCRIVKLLPDGKILVSVQADCARLSLSLDQIEFLPKSNDIEASEGLQQDLSALENYSDEDLQTAKDRFETISKVLAGEISQVEAIEHLAISSTHFYRIRKRYCNDIGVLSVVSNKRGVKANTTRLEEAVEEIIQRSINDRYLGRSATCAVVWKDVEKNCIKQKLPIPSMSSVRQRLMQRDPKELLLKKSGQDAASQKHQARPGKKEVSRPLQITQMDHTLVDVILVDDLERKPLGRPWLTVIVDLYSRVILGYYLCLHAPSAVSVSCAITHAAFPKFTFLSKLGIDESKYPHYGVPEVIGIDNAKEFKSIKFERACHANKIDPQWRPLGKKHYGGHVERLFGTLMIGAVHLLPGTTYSNVVKRRGQDSDKAAVMGFGEFSKWLARQVCIYHGRIHSQLGMSPAEKWKAYFRKADGGISFPPMVADPIRFRLDFMPENHRNISPEGIKLNGHLYWCSSLTQYVGRGKFKVKFDPFSLKTIWVYIEGEYLPVPFSDSALEDRSLFEYKALLKYRRIIGVLQPGRLEDHSLVAMMDESDEIIREGKKETRKAKKSSAAKKEYLAAHGLGAGLTDGEEEKSKIEADYSLRANLFRGASYD